MSSWLRVGMFLPLSVATLFAACGSDGDGEAGGMGGGGTDAVMGGTGAIGTGRGDAGQQPVETTTSLSQWGVTWTFSEAVPYGQFANGDYWVVGPVTITEIDPAFNGTNHGWQVNPLPGSDQGFDYGVLRSPDGETSFDPALVPDLPYEAQPGSSIVKAISKYPGETADCYPACLKTAAVLTVVDAIPVDNGATSFRPPYVGSAKPLYSTTAIRTDLLPSLSPVDAAPSLDEIVERFQRVQIQHGFGRIGRLIHPEDNMDDYSPDNACDENDAILRLMLDDPIEDKRLPLIMMLQNGIDSYHALVEGQTWPAGGGYEPGHMLNLSFAAMMLDDSAMAQAVTNADFFVEYAGVYRSSVTTAPDGVLYGFPSNQGSEKTRRDPNQRVDAPGGGYLFCCLALPWKGAVLATRLMPVLQEPLDEDEWLELAQFADRWVSFGWWFPSPDADGLVTNAGDPCVDLHNTQANEGYRGTPFQANMWDAYR